MTSSSLIPLTFAQRHGACPHCCLRFANIDDEKLYQASPGIVQNWILSQQEHSQDEQPEPDCVPSFSSCLLCLGILPSLTDNTDAKAALVQAIRDSEYELHDFGLAFKLPGSVLIRQAAATNIFEKQSNVSPSSIPNYVDLKDALKWILLPYIKQELNNIKAVNELQSTLRITITMLHQESLLEAEEFLAAQKPPSSKQQSLKRKRGKSVVLPDGNGVIQRLLIKLRDSTQPEVLNVFPAPVNTVATLDVSLERASEYLKGRYLKFERGLSQSPWVLDGTRIGESSVQEAIAEKLLPEFKTPGDYKFHSAGREDVDVRMLGNGRPFILELVNSKIKSSSCETSFSDLMSLVNSSQEDVVEIRELMPATKEDFINLQAGADSKRKTYACVVWTSKVITEEDVEKLEGICDLSIAQMTPVRVLHRRTLMTREKVIHDAKVEKINDHYMCLYVTTSAGTYVKEFVHGDLGRTLPNVGTILNCRADILQLDVHNLID